VDTTISAPCEIGSGPYSASGMRTYVNTSAFRPLRNPACHSSMVTSWRQQNFKHRQSIRLPHSAHGLASKSVFMFVQACEDQPESRPPPCMWPAYNSNVTLFMPSFQKVLYAHGTSCLVENTWNAMPLREHGSIGLSQAPIHPCGHYCSAFSSCQTTPPD